ncbi:MAG: tetratricopeptide repeat protein [Vicingaceae bacterium]
MKKRLFTLLYLFLSLALVRANENLEKHNLEAKAKKALVEKNADSARYFLHQIIRKYPKEIVMVARSYNSLGMIDVQEGFTKRGLEYLHKAIDAFEKNNNDTLLAISLYNTGKSYKMLAQYDKAAELLLRALGLFEALDNHFYASLTNSSLGNLYKESNDFEVALKFQDKAIQIAQKTGDSSRLAKFLNNKGKVYTEMEFFQEAINCFDSALTIKKLKGFVASSAYTLYNLGEAEFLRGKYQKAINYFNQALGIHENSKNKREIAYTYNFLGKAYSRINEKKKSLSFLNKAQIIAAELDMNDLLLSNYEAFYQLYDSTNDLKNALASYKKYNQKYKEVIDQKKQEKIKELQIKYEVEKKEQENKLLIQKAEINKLKINKQENSIWFWRWITVMAFVLILFVLVLSRKYYTLFEKEKRLAKMEKDLNIEQHHRIKNHLQVLAGILSFQQRKIQDHTAKEVILESRNRVNVIKMLHQHFYQNEIYDGTAIQMHSYLKDIIENLILLFDKREIKTDLKISDVALSPDKALPLGLIINEIISNALKYGLNQNKKSCLTVLFTEENRQITLIIEDNGNGFKSLTGIDASIGLNLIDQLIDQMDAKLERNFRSGTQYVIKFKS